MKAIFKTSAVCAALAITGAAFAQGTTYGSSPDAKGPSAGQAAEQRHINEKNGMSSSTTTTTDKRASTTGSTGTLGASGSTDTTSSSTNAPAVSSSSSTTTTTTDTTTSKSDMNASDHTSTRSRKVARADRG